MAVWWGSKKLFISSTCRFSKRSSQKIMMEQQEQATVLTDFLDGTADRTTRPRFNRWGGEIVIDDIEQKLPKDGG
jgi:hypothetical protein